MVPRVQALVQEMADHRVCFEAFCRSLTPDELATRVPGAPWTALDYIAHLATIEALINPWLGAMAGATGIPAPEVPPPQPFDLDDWNEAMVARRQGLSLHELFSEAAGNRLRYSGILDVLTDAQLDMKIPFGGDRKAIDLPPVVVPLVNLLTGIALHDPTHMQDILRALPQHRDDPAVREWLDAVDVSRIDPEMAARRA